MFVVIKYIAPKMAKKVIMPCKVDKKNKRLQPFGLKTPKFEFLTLNSCPPSSFTTLSTRMTTKRGKDPLMNLDAR